MRPLNPETIPLLEALHRLKVPSTAVEISRASGIPRPRVSELSRIAVTNELMVATGENHAKKYTLAPDWRRLANIGVNRKTLTYKPKVMTRPPAGVVDDPCTAFDCVNKVRCADKKLACSAYQHFVEQNVTTPPTTDHQYRAGKYYGYMVDQPVKPSRDIYMQCVG